MEAYCCGNQDGGAATLEALQSLLPLHLASVTMDTGARIAPGVKEVIQSIATFLRLHKHQGEGVLP